VFSLGIASRPYVEGRDALRRDPSPCEGPFSDPTVSSRESISVFSVPRAKRVVNPFFFVFSFFRAFVIKDS
jgi:hypothetical protein